MKFSRTHFLRLLIPLALAVLGAALCAALVPHEIEQVKQQLLGFPDSDVPAHQARPTILAALCFLPLVAGFLYALGGTLDRYIARQFAGIFGICLITLTVIWLLLDLSNNIGHFLESKHVLLTLFSFYTTRSPAILLLLLPYSLLLSLLHSLGKLSGSREIIAIIQSGRSIIRLTLPLIIGGVLLSLLTLGLNYQWAPVAESRITDILAEAVGKPVTAATHVLYRNAVGRRLWEIGAFPENYQNGGPLLDVEVTTTREDQTLASRLTAKTAFWDRATRAWTFDHAMMALYTPGQPPLVTAHDQPLVIPAWTETPWQLVKPGLDAGDLGVPDLSGWLKSNTRNHEFANPAPYLTQYQYRWALPFTCLVTVLLATPLGIHFSRRGPGGGIFLAIVLSALMLLFSSISIALGESGTLRPTLAAWLPNLAFGLLGLYLFRRRITGQPIYLILRRILPGND